MRILIVYGSTHGHTARIAGRIAERLREHSADVVVTGQPGTVTPSNFDAIVVGARVHGSRYPWRITRFIRQNVHALRARPSAFFSVSLLQLGTDAAKRAEHATLPAQRNQRFGWTPGRSEVMAGALMWRTQYGVLAPLFKRMWRKALGDLVDPSLDEQVFTDWAQVDRFADAVFDLATGRTERAVA
jgi:menaquinone-dependent protoporphyrinogen oxidase